jgi:hypothetical protein
LGGVRFGGVALPIMAVDRFSDCCHIGNAVNDHAK